MNTEEQIYMNFATGIHAPQMLNPHVCGVVWARSGSSENTPLSSCASYHHFTALQRALNTLEAASGSSSSIIWPEKKVYMVPFSSLLLWPAFRTRHKSAISTRTQTRWYKLLQWCICKTGSLIVICLSKPFNIFLCVLSPYVLFCCGLHRIILFCDCYLSYKMKDRWFWWKLLI